jgi:LacI family transcriptional regulator
LAKLPSIRTVADHAGVSTATVSNVLNMRRNVAPALVSRVRAAVAELGYIADLGAARLRSRRSTVAAVVVPDIANPFFGALVATLEEESHASGYDLLITSSGGDPDTEAARLRALLTWRPTGLIVVPCDDNFAAGAIARAAGVPMVAADRGPAEHPIDSVTVDNRAMAAQVAQHLLSAGHRKILVIASNFGIGNVGERCDGLREAAGGAAEVDVLEAGVGVAEVREHLSRRLEQGDLPHALFTVNNLATMGTLEALHAHNLVVGRDIALVGFDEEEWMRVVSPTLTAVRQPTEEIARTAWARLMARIGGDDSPPHDIRLGCTLEVRASSRRIRQDAEQEAAE